MSEEKKSSACRTPGGCSPVHAPSRRDFLQFSGLGAAGAMLGWHALRPLAGPFAKADFADHLVPADKKLSREWLASLTARGAPEVFRGEELRWIGMPVGGICCGQLYLGGDGRLWNWDIFRSDYQSDYGGMSSGIHYATPPEATSPVKQGFALRVRGAGGEEVRALDATGFADVSFRGEYPVGRVRYRDGDCPVEVDLEAFSPFVPLDHDDSALPATLMSFRLRNAGDTKVTVRLAGWLQNTVCPDHHTPGGGMRVNRILERPGRRTLACTAEAARTEDHGRPPIVFADFEGETYEGWTAEGTSFGDGPRAHSELPSYQDVSGFEGERFVNAHNTRQGEDVGGGDAHTGKLTSDPFPIARDYIHFAIGGGRHPGKTCINLLVDGEVVRTATGHDANRMRVENFAVAQWRGREARLEIVDAVAGPWGNIGIDHIVFADQPAGPALEELPGYGSMALTLVGSGATGTPLVAGDAAAREVLSALDVPTPPQWDAPFDAELVGALGRDMELAPGEEAEITFIVSWWFPYYPRATGEFSAIEGIEHLNRHYENRFPGASAVAGYVVRNLERLRGATRLWNRTWYDSTLPYWLLDRAFVSLDCLATQTCHWFDNDRFYGWEGVCCCPGTCQHVWNYAQGLARIFPSLERRTRERVDYGIAFHETGELGYRAESAQHIAHDGQCGTILRAYREHLTAPDDAYLKRTWTRIKKSLEFLIEQDGGTDGVLEGKQYNTLDQAWYGPMAWISSMYVAALRAGEAMAKAVGDETFAERCRTIAAAGSANIAATLFDGEYFVHHPDPAHPEATNTNAGCHIDQVFGQSLAFQVGLPRVLPRKETVAALEALWKYNFAPDAGGYRDAMQGVVKGGRWYAMPGEAGLLMCTWPKGGADKAGGDGWDWAVGYFNECMNGFEYQVASHLVWEGAPDSDLVSKGLAVTRAVHDRYHASRRNPYNEIECSDHYSRSMASYGVFLAACGFEYDGPRRHLGFAPRLSPDDFRAPFTAAAGWGTLRQTRTADRQEASIEVLWGRVPLATVALEAPPSRRLTAARIDGEPVRYDRDEDHVLLTLPEEVLLEVADRLAIELEFERP